MTDESERRQGPDRRSRARGGRRTSDPSGYSPLVLVVDRDTHGRETCEAILAKLRFAVAPVESAEKALSIMAALKPDIVVVRESEAALLRGISAPLVVMNSSQDPLALVEEIRRALRAMPRRQSGAM
jgi:CheY-like chemotaxis protein